MADITAIILTKNEESNITDCIRSIEPLVSRIIVIDSFSTDQTLELAEKLGAEIMEHEFVNHAKQFQYALEHADIKTQWVLRIDADERLTDSIRKEIQDICEINKETDINGIIVRFEVNFMGKKLRHGGIYPFKKLIVFKYGKGYVEDRNMDEHIVLTEGRSVETRNDAEHHDYKDLTFWINKHNWYASKEALDYFDVTKHQKDAKEVKMARGAAIKRWIKYKVYYQLPMGMRAHLYFWYRYYFKMGFLDGREGKIFAFMQAYWYRFLVDAKIYEQELKTDKNEHK